jgi:hypothetical protein
MKKKRDFATPNGPMKKSKVSLVDFVMSLIVIFYRKSRIIANVIDICLIL